MSRLAQSCGYDAETAGATSTAFVVNPSDAKALAKLKDEANSDRPLLGVDASAPTWRQIAAVPL
jgi:hypothetical protein